MVRLPTCLSRKEVIMEPEILETTLAWDEMEEYQQAMAIAAFVSLLKVPSGRKHIVHRIFELGKPLVVFSKDYKYCRIHEGSVAVMTVLTKNYL